MTSCIQPWVPRDPEYWETRPSRSLESRASYHEDRIYFTARHMRPLRDRGGVKAIDIHGITCTGRVRSFHILTVWSEKPRDQVYTPLARGQLVCEKHVPPRRVSRSTPHRARHFICNATHVCTINRPALLLLQIKRIVCINVTRVCDRDADV